jgi:hypothetical protein
MARWVGHVSFMDGRGRTWKHRAEVAIDAGNPQAAARNSVAAAKKRLAKGQRVTGVSLTLVRITAPRRPREVSVDTIS